MTGYKISACAASLDACQALRDAAGDRDRIIMPHRTVPQFMIGMRMLAPLARIHLGTSDISGLGSDYFSVSAGFSTHTDNDYVQALPGTFCSVWLPLLDITEDNGPLVIDGKAILCKAGDAVILDGDTPHRSCAGKPGAPRPVALFTYIVKGKPFRPGFTQQRSEVPL